MIKIYFFDMDYTLINLDCDVSWKQFLVKEGLLPEKETLEKVDYYFESYVNGVLDSDEFLLFQLAEFRGKSVDQIAEIANRHFEKCVKSKIYSDAAKEVQKAINNGKKVSLLSATNAPIATPLANYLGIEDIVATELELVDGVYSGKIRKTYCCGEGKVVRAGEYCENMGVSLSDAAYSGILTWIVFFIKHFSS